MINNVRKSHKMYFKKRVDNSNFVKSYLNCFLAVNYDLFMLELNKRHIPQGFYYYYITKIKSVQIYIKCVFSYN